MAPRRTIPSTPDAAVYERVIEIQETLKDVAKEQSAAGVQRDAIMMKMAINIEAVTQLLKEHTAMLGTAKESVVEAVAATSELATAGEHRFTEIMARLGVMARATRRLSWLMPLAVFLGAACGEAVRDPVAHLLHW